MRKYRHITESASRRIIGFVESLSKAPDLSGMADRFLGGAERVIGGDCFVWNDWSLDWRTSYSARLTDAYQKEFLSRLDVFESVVGEHPVVKAGKFDQSALNVMQMSDFEGSAAFENNPLYRDVYRHLDSRYQIAFAPCLLPDRRILLTINRRLRDFTLEEKENLEFLGGCLDLVSKQIYRRAKLEGVCHVIEGFIKEIIPNLDPEDITQSEWLLLGDIMDGRRLSDLPAYLGLRRDTLDKKLASIRSKFGVENHTQLLSVLAELRAATFKEDKRG